MIDGHWFAVRDGDPRGRALFLRHYSSTPAARSKRDARGNAARFIGPGEKLILLTADCSALFAWRKEEYRLDAQEGVNNPIFRNEGPIQSSELIREACELAWGKWPGERLFTFVDETLTARRRSRRAQPGQCFIKAGWTLLDDRTKNHGYRILEILPTAMELAS
jgi:hypothetical protein